jgi:hypothetical protein
LKVGSRVKHKARPELGVGVITSLGEVGVDILFGERKFSGITYKAIELVDHKEKVNTKSTTSKKSKEGNKVITWFLLIIPIFIVVLIFNQMAYGSCFEGYCLAAASPKVLIFSIIIAFFIAVNSD